MATEPQVKLFTSKFKKNELKILLIYLLLPPCNELCKRKLINIKGTKVLAVISSEPL